MAPRQQQSSGFSALLALALLGVGALLRDWGMVLGHGTEDGRGASTAPQHLAMLEGEVAELRQQLNTSAASLRANLESLRQELRAANDSVVRQLRAEMHAAPARPGARAVAEAEAPARLSGPPAQLSEPPAKLVATDTSLVQTPQALTEANLLSVGRTLVDRLKKCCLDEKVQRRGDSVAWLEAIAIVSAMVVTQAEVLIESGVASGFSSEVWGRFFAGTSVQIYSIDKNSEGQNDNAAAAKRLAPFPNIKFVEGDSLDEVPKLLQRHQGQRIGVFVDGPKTRLGSDLALRCIERSPDVKFAAQHDCTEIGLLDTDLWKAHNVWERVALRTWERQWRQEFSTLDGCPADVQSNCGWGVLMLAAQDDKPMSGNDREFRQVVGEGTGPGWDFGGSR